jgi:hypothetical protein
MLDTAKTNFFIMNNQNPFWDNDDKIFVSGNTPPSQTTTPKFDTEINYQNYLWDDDLEFLNGDDLYVPENTPPSLTTTPEFSFRVDYQTYLEDNDIYFLGDNPKVSTNTPDSGTNLELLDNTLNVSEDTQDWDTNIELLEDNNLHVSGNTPYRDTNLELREDNNLNVSGNTPNLDNDIEFLEGENLYISQNTQPLQPPTEENVLCPILQSIIEASSAANSDAGCRDLCQDTSFQQAQADSDAGYGDLYLDTLLQQVQENSDIGYKVWQNTCLQQTQAKPDDDSSCNRPKHKHRRVRKLQGDIESMQGSKSIRTPHACAECKRRKIRCDGRHWQCLGCRSPKQVIAQPQEDKCVHCFTDRRICDQAKPSCGNCVKRKLKCRPQENAVPSSLFFYSEVYSGFPEDALNA